MIDGGITVSLSKTEPIVALWGVYDPYGLLRQDAMLRLNCCWSEQLKEVPSGKHKVTLRC